MGLTTSIHLRSFAEDSRLQAVRFCLISECQVTTLSRITRSATECPGHVRTL